MPREWHPFRFFVREEGRRYPTILFWLFLVPLLALVIAGCYAVLNRRAEQTRVTAALTGTPTATAMETPAPAPTHTPGPPAGEPTPTEYVYDDPSDWEFIERTDPTGTTYLDLQDWQREQVWHAFEGFWNLLYQNENGLPAWEEVEPYVAGSFIEFARGTFDFADQNGKYLYILEGIEDIPHRAIVLRSAGDGGVQVGVVLGMERSYQIEYRDPETGQVLEQDKWLPYETWSFVMGFQDGQWVIQDEEHESFGG